MKERFFLFAKERKVVMKQLLMAPRNKLSGDHFPSSPSGNSIGVATSGTFLITNQQVHFQDLSQKINRGDALLEEYLFKAEHGLRALGLGFEESKIVAIKSLLKVAYRDSFIQAFNDIFMTLSLALCVSVIFVGLLKGGIKSTNMEIH